MSGLVQQTEYRALELMDRIPALHEGVMVTRNDFQPHLRRGEVAVVDTQDKSLAFGELFVMMMSEGTPHMTLEIVQLLREVQCVGCTGLMYGFSFHENGDVVFEGRRCRYVDGPLRIEHWPEKIVGRIVSVVKPRWEGRS